MTVTLEQGEQAVEGLCKLVFAEDLTIYAIEGLKEGLAAHLSSYDSFELNLAQVEEMDSAGVQLLMAFKSELMREKKQLRLNGLTWESSMSDESLQIFTDEAEDLLGVAEQALLNLDNLDDDAETLEGINDLFDGQGMSDELKQKDDELITKLNVYLGGSSEESPLADTTTPIEAAGQSPKVAGGVENENWHISLRFGIDALRNGMDPASFIGYLNKMGDLTSVVLLDDAIPSLVCAQHGQGGPGRGLRICTR